MFASSSPPLGYNSSSTIRSQPLSCMDNTSNNKRKRRPAGTPDPDAEVVSLSPKTLLESDRYVCEICSQGFQRDQNLQMHRRRHKVPWKLLKRETAEVRKRVYVCPEPSCLHHDPCHALGDLVGIKKHFRRKHSNHKQVESFIEHQDACNGGRIRSKLQAPQSRVGSSTSPTSETNISAAWATLKLPKHAPTVFLLPEQNQSAIDPQLSLELQLLPLSNSPSSTFDASISRASDENSATRLQLSIGSTNSNSNSNTDPDQNSQKSIEEPSLAASRLKEQAHEQLRLAISEKALADNARQEARRQIELAEQEFANAKRIRLQAQVELDKARILKDHATKQMNATLMQITCLACKQQFQPTTPTEENSLVISYMSSAATEGEGENDNRIWQFQVANT
ncbi:hypothetical protein MRB53_008616 [Persea americana]|uniref:Uncharacterized protein n=1 Tax=Persea americana TaxID=3435 RepID=A0ACC2MMM6_PERAE|nr:hypothetical protein MRB53_008616 [Persea americana]